jgi:catechol 2,3-dioxygenase-like lactoylglutathione lyase family enzyme
VEWEWGFVTAVVEDVDAASGFYTEALGLPELGAGQFSSIGAEGRLFGLGTNASVAVVRPVTAGLARQVLEAYRGGLCHLGVVAAGASSEGESVRSPLGEGRMVALTGDLAIEIVEADRAPSGDSSPTSVVVELDHVAVVVPDLDAASSRMRSLGFDEDAEASHWDFPQLQTRNVVFPSRSGYLEINQAFSSEGVFGSLAAARGAGIVGLTLTVADMQATVARLRERGVSVSDPGPVLAQTPDGDRDLGLSAVVSMKHSFGARLFLFAPSPMAPHYGPNSSAVS